MNNLKDFKYYAGLFISVVVIGSIYMADADGRENAHSDVVDMEDHGMVEIEGEQITNMHMAEEFGGDGSSVPDGQEGNVFLETVGFVE